MININLVKSNFINSLKSKMSQDEIKSIWDTWVLCEILNLTKIQCIIDQNIDINSYNVSKINDLISHLLANNPIQYFFGYSYFKNLKITLDSNVLIPRIETEELVDLVLSKINKKGFNGIDIGTGSGCISILLKKELKLNMYAVDFSPDVLNRAKINAKNHNVNLQFKLLNILNFDKYDLFPNFDFIVSNPPYVLKSEVSIDSNIHAEPTTSIFVNHDDPLVFYRAICVFAQNKLKKSGIMFFEINPLFHKDLIILFKQYNYSNIETRTDFFGKKRFIIVSS